MAISISQLRLDDLDPHFFAYGQLPLFLAYFTGIAFTGDSQVHFSQAVYLLRFWSATFSALTLILAWFLAKEIFRENRERFLFILLLIFSPGLIQFAHFGTTESMLVFVALALCYFSLKLAKTKEKIFVFLLALIAGIGLAVKLTAALFLLTPILAITLAFKHPKGKLALWRILGWSVFFGLLTLLIWFSLSPYNLIDFKDFYSSFVYESQVATGKNLVFYTRQFFQTIPIFFQLSKIFPWVLGLPMFLGFLAGIFLLINDFFKKRSGFKLWLLIHAAWLPWFLFNAFLFAKWTRFMAPTVPFLVLTVVFFLGELREKFLAICCLLMVLPGIFFLVEVYGKTDIRLRASQWMGLNLKPGAVIITEAGNVVDLPLFNNNNFEMINLDLYHLDENPLIADKLDFYLDKADYILIPSRRIFANHLRRKEDFPQAAAYYQRLFSGESGFRMIKEISPFPKWQQWLLGNDLVAEETWTVFDHPTIRIFARI